jgi:hypothetical protein
MDQGDRVKSNQPDETGAQSARAPYQMPAIAWEEPFQPVAAFSCSMLDELSCARTATA